jgi:two-component system LytT family response regulator
MSIRTLIIDDEPPARRSIWRFLKSHPEFEVVAECGDGESAVATIIGMRPDLVFLDVQLPELDGVEVVRQVGAERMPATIFVTAYDRYALQAFDAEAVDYLLKPVGRERFTRALDRARSRIFERPNRDAGNRLAALLQQMETQENYAERLPIPANGRIQFVKTIEIDWIAADGNYARLYAGGGQFEVRETLANLERRLNPRDFARIHRSTIVNIHRIREIQPWFHGYHLVLLQTGQKLRMSRYQHETAERLGFGGKHQFVS